MGQPERRFLGDVGDLGAEVAAVTEGGADLGTGCPGDDTDLLDAGGDHRLDAVEEDRLVGHRHQLLRPRVGDRSQARAFTASQDQRLHRPEIVTFNSWFRPRRSTR